MRTPLTFLASLFLLPLSAQHTIVYGDLSPFGVQTDMHVLVSPTTLPPLSDGNDQTWDLSGVTLQEAGTLDFDPASGTPYASTYPNANWAWAQDITGLGPNYIYLDISETAINIIARDVPSSPDNYTDPAQVMKFPMSLAESFTDTYVHTTGSSSYTWTYSGFGTVMTPLGTFTDVAKLESSEGDLLLWSTAPLYPILIAEGDNVLFFAENNVGVTEQHDSAVRIYPDPCQDHLTVADAAIGSMWRILDAQGRTLYQGSMASGANGNVDVRGLATGSYVFMLNEGNRVRRSTFMKQ